MRVLVDPESGELVEVLPEDVASTEPYDYADAKRAVMAATREKRAVLTALDEAIDEKGAAEEDYLLKKADAVEDAKAEHGATVAESIAKGDPEVAKAAGRRERAQDRVKALQARLVLCSEDRASLNRLMEWSREADADGWKGRS